MKVSYLLSIFILVKALDKALTRSQYFLWQHRFIDHGFNFSIIYQKTIFLPSLCVVFANFEQIYNSQYAHRACVQRWCNEKGDITCEICHEVNPNSDCFLINILLNFFLLFFIYLYFYARLWLNWN